MAGTDSQRIIDLPDEAATRALAEDVAAILGAGDVITLSGGLGAGKTTFARALLRAHVNDDRLEVPSPTFTLVQTYAGRLPIAHFDFYRLESADELDEIGFDDAVADGAVVVEWPERAGARLPTVRMNLAFEIVGAGRKVTVAATGEMRDRFRRSRDIRSFLDGAGWRSAARRHLQGDASTRSYERVSDKGRKAVLMDWPPPKQKTARQRIPYRAEDVRAFIAVGDALRAGGPLDAGILFMPTRTAGFLLMEDFGCRRRRRRRNADRGALFGCDGRRSGRYPQPPAHVRICCCPMEALYHLPRIWRRCVGRRTRGVSGLVCRA